MLLFLWLELVGGPETFTCPVRVTEIADPAGGEGHRLLQAGCFRAGDAVIVMPTVPVQVELTEVGGDESVFPGQPDRFHT